MAKQIITDDEANLKRQARRRLIGAIALTVLVVILLPMVLDSEPPAPSPDIDLQIPDKDKAGEFVPKMVLPPSSQAEAASHPAKSSAIAPLLDNKVSAVPPESKPAAVAIKPLAADSATNKDVTPDKNATPDSAREQNKAVKVAPKTQTKPAAKVVHRGYVLQVGAFANAESAKKLQEKLNAQGYSSYTEKAGNKIRVRIGDFSTQADAERVRRKLEIQGYQPNVINLN